MLCVRSDRDDSELFEFIRSGCLLSLHLSGRSRSANGSRTARFYVDDVECAVFTNIPHDGGKLRTLCRAGIWLWPPDSYTCRAGSSVLWTLRSVLVAQS